MDTIELIKQKGHRLKRWVAHAAHGARARIGLAGRPSDTGVRAYAQTRRELLTLALPIAGAMAGEVALGLVDTKLVAGLGPAALGGVGLGMTVLYLFYAVVFGILRGIKVRAAHAIGEGRPKDARRYAEAGVLIGLVLGSSAFIFGRNPGPVLAWLGADEAIREPAAQFLGAITWGAPATCAVNAFIQHRQAIGDARTPLIVGLTGNLWNAVFGYALIYGKWGLPALGVAGSGYATAVTEALELVWLGALFLREERGGATAGLDLARATREVCEVGVPTGLHFGAELLAFATFTLILGSLGSREIAAHQIAMAIIRASFLPGIAVGEAASVLVARALGARNLGEADRVTKAALALAIAFMATCGVIFAAFGAELAGVFTNASGVLEVTRRLLLVAAVFQVFDAANIVLRSALRGAKDVRFVAAVGVTIVWTCIPGSAWLFGRQLGYGAMGGWFGFVLETLLASTVLMWRYRRGSWRRRYEDAAQSKAVTPLQAAAAE